MTLRRRLDRVEAARGARPQPEADAAFAAACAWLDDAGDRAAAGDLEARDDREAFRRMVRHGGA